MHYSFTTDFFNLMYVMGATQGLATAANATQGEVKSKLHFRPESKDSRLTSFEQLVGYTKFRMFDLDAHSNSIAASFSQRNSLNGKMQLNAGEWLLHRSQHAIANLRMVHIKGPKNEIINTWIFPNRPSQSPVFAAEMIAVNGCVKVAFLDMQVPALDASLKPEVSLTSAVLAARFSTLPCDEPAPNWATDASQGHFTYARNVPAEQTWFIENAYTEYLDAYLNAFMTNEATVQTSASNFEISQLHQYQLHHMEHSPGKNFLGKLFGSEWTEAFMTEFLFAKPRG